MAALTPRILHLGFGGFARAHTAVAVHRMNAALPAQMPRWGIIAARLHSGRAELDALDAAGGRYALVEADAEADRLEEIASIAATLHPARDGTGALPEVMAAPGLSLVTLTVTEKGYGMAGGALDRTRPEIAADLADGGWRSVPGLLAEGLARRRAAGAGGLTLLSCDNLSENGRSLALAVGEMAGARDPDLARWISATCTFPSSMVDRITPAPDAAARALIARLAGHEDPNGIVTEPFLQWVIEDRFAAERPPLDLGGATFADDIRPWEAMKLRMLNASHTMLAHLGGLIGLETIDACMAEPLLVRAARRLMLAEAAPTLPPLPGADLPAYAAALLARFANPRLGHRCAQIATDTSQKLPPRLLAPIAWHLDHGGNWPVMALAIAGWMARARGLDEAGRPLPLNDPLAGDIRTAAAGPDGAAHVRAMLSLAAIFPPALAADPRFVGPVRAAYLALRAGGVRAALDALAD
jgi:fructuronate reductase